MKAKKIPYYLLLIILTAGASIILGFFSFTGMFTLWPILPLALGAFALSVSYEAEIYLQNIKNALNKLFLKQDYLKHHLANEHLLAHFPEETDSDDCPQFFKDYKKQLNLLHKFGHHALDKESRVRKRIIEKRLKDMQKWYALQLFPTKLIRNPTVYEHELHVWLNNPLRKKRETNKLLKDRNTSYTWAKLFSVLSGTLVFVGTTYLLVEGFAIVPILAAIPFTVLPAIIIPLALIAGAAYAFLTFNAVTDMINNNTIRQWYFKIRNDFKEGLTLRKVLNAGLSIFLVTLAVSLTICTAGTWWTVAKNTRPIFNWMQKIPSFILGLIPLVTGLSSLIFNLQNTNETMTLIDEATRPKPHMMSRFIKFLSKNYNALRERENWLQLFNPFRLFIKLTLTPLRVLLFLGHLISIGVTADRVPGIPEILSAILGIISEGFEDLHYFAGHLHEHHHHGHGHFKELLNEQLKASEGHNHDLDLPTRILKFIFTPVYFLSSVWDCCSSKLNTKEVLSFKDAWMKQTGQKHPRKIDPKTEKYNTSHDWKIQHTVYRIGHFKKNHFGRVLFKPEVAIQKEKALTKMQKKVLKESQYIKEAEPRINRKSLSNTLNSESKKRIFNSNRLFKKQTTRTKAFLAELPDRIGLSGS